MPASRSVASVLLRELGDSFLYTLKAGPAGGSSSGLLKRWRDSRSVRSR